MRITSSYICNAQPFANFAMAAASPIPATIKTRGIMRATNIVFMLLAMAVLVPSAALAQLGKKSLLPEGQLFLPVGNFSAMEKDLRVYGLFGVTTGDAAFKDGTNLDLDADEIAAALDFKGGPAVFSVGYSLDTFTQSTTVSGVGIELEDETTNLGGRASFLFGESGVASIQIFIEDETTTVTGSLSGFSISDSADTRIIDISLGASMDVSEGIRLGGAFSPEVSDKAEFNGFLAGSETRNGHGTQIAVGLGYNTPELAAGLEFSMESESEDALAKAERAITATAEILFGDTSLTGQFVFFQEDILRVNGDLQSPDSEGTVIGVLARFRLGGGVLGLQLQRLSEESFDTGVPADDVDRLDSVDLTVFAVRFAADF